LRRKFLGGGVRMQPYTKKQIIIFIVSIILYSLLFTALVQFMNRDRSTTSFIAAEWLPAMEIIGAIISLYTIVSMWTFPRRLRRRVNALPPRVITTRRRFSPGTGILMIMYGLLITPNLYGLVLFFMGMPATGYYYFAGLSVVGGLAWGIYTLRTNQE
jgi:hypothetical protein